MVCQANAGKHHDFLSDPIRPVLCDGWVVAEETTLGADNGIGVALALAALEANDLIHPPLEVLLTVNEESGMDGARGLAPGTLAGRYLINLDSEEWGYFYLGCAGGVDVEVRADWPLEPLPEGYGVCHLEVAGLRGGHSGLDIHLGRGNAIKLLGEALAGLAKCADPRLIAMQGGSARNAIPREASALLALPEQDRATCDAWLAQCRAAWQERFAQADAGVSLTAYAVPSQSLAGQALSRTGLDTLLAWLEGARNGVAHLSAGFPGVVESSTNLGVASLAEGRFSATAKVRSLHDEEAVALAGGMENHAVSLGLQAWQAGAYPGWAPNPDSPMLALCRQVYASHFGSEAGVQVIHAGLECGLFAASHPHLEMISFGPDIRGAHAPGERVEIASVARCWELLQALLQALSKK